MAIMFIGDVLYCMHQSDGYFHPSDGVEPCNQPSYPQHLRLEREKDTSQHIGEFLEWLADQDVHLMHWNEEAGDWNYESKPIQKRLAEYFGIDYTALQAEKDMMLKHIRAVQRDV